MGQPGRLFASLYPIPHLRLRTHRHCGVLPGPILRRHLREGKGTEAYRYRASLFLQRLPWYAGVLYIVAAAGPPFLYKYIIELAAFAPIVCAFLAFVILAATALANWYAPFRKKVSYWLTQQDNELVAAAEAQPTLFALNAFFLYVAAIFIAVFCLSVFG